MRRQGDWKTKVDFNMRAGEPGWGIEPKPLLQGSRMSRPGGVQGGRVRSLPPLHLAGFCGVTEEWACVREETLRSYRSP